MELPEKDFMLWHHLGMGDHFILHGLVRRLYKEKKFNKFKLIAKKHYSANVRFMYRDLPLMEILEIANDAEAQHLFGMFEGEKLKHHLSSYGTFPNAFTEEAAYLSLGFNVSDRYDYFHLERDYDKEDISYKKIIDFEEDYIFIADDAGRNYKIDDKKASMNREVKIIRSSDLLNYGIFDLIKVMENALDIHVIYSSFMMFADCMKENFPKIYAHESYIGKIKPFWPDDENLKSFWKSRNVSIL